MLCSIMNLPPPSSARVRYTELVSNALRVVSDESMLAATKDAIKENKEEIEENEDKNDL